MKTITFTFGQLLKKKKVLLLFMISFLFPGFHARASVTGPDDSALCLEISGRILNLKLLEDNWYKVELIHDGRIVDSLDVKNKKEFKFRLKRNSVYGIRISKPGYADRIISIDTKLPDYATRFFKFEFDTELIQKDLTKKLNSDALDFPIAVIHFYNDLKGFYYDEEYTTYIKRKLYLGQEF